MPDREKLIKHFEHLLNAAKGNYQDFVDLTVDGGEEILAMLKKQEAQKFLVDENGKITPLPVVFPNCPLKEYETVVRCKDCKHAEILKWLDDAIICNKHNYTGVRPEEFFCADGERRESE